MLKRLEGITSNTHTHTHTPQKGTTQHTEGELGNHTAGGDGGVAPPRTKEEEVTHIQNMSTHHTQKKMGWTPSGRRVASHVTVPLPHTPPNDTQKKMS